MTSAQMEKILAAARKLAKGNYTTEVDVSGASEDIGALGEALNQVARRLAEQMNKTAELQRKFDDIAEKNSRLIDRFPGVVYIIHVSRDGSYSFPFVSKNADALLGVHAEDIMRDPMLLIGARHPDDVAAMEEAIRQARQTVQPFHFEIRHLVRGEYRWFECFSRPEQLSDGKVRLDGFGFMLDITQRKETERALRESEKTYRLLAENATDIIWTTDMNLKFTYFSPSYTTYFGFTTEEGLNQTMEEMTTPDSFQRAMKVFQDELLKEETGSVDSQRTRTLELEIRHKNGGTIWVEATVKFLRDSQNRAIGLQGTTRVITERKMVEEALRESEHRLKEIADNMIDMVSLADLDGSFKYVNSAHKTCLGYEPEFLVGRTIFEVAHPEDVKRILAEIATGKETLGVRKLECRLRRADGSYTWLETIGTFLLNADGNPREMLFSARDISDRKRAEEALRKSEEKYRLIADNMADTIAVLDLNLNFTYISPSITRLRGFTAEEALERSIGQVMTPESIQVAFQVLKDEMELEQSGAADPNRTRIVELEEYRKDGSTTWISNHFSFLRDENGVAVGILVASRDISDRKRAEEAKDRLEAQLRQASKMEAVGRLAGGVAHDFNNLLTGISGYTEILLSGVSKGDPMHADLSEIKKAADRAASLTEQLLAFSRKQVIDPKVIDLNELLADSTKMLGRLIGEDVELVFVPGKNLGSVQVDPHQIEQVLINLAVNARDAMPDGGKLTIETTNVVIDEEYVRNRLEAKPGHYVLLTVSDNGCGMPPEVVEHLFEPFFTTKEKGKGTGLGLSMIYGIVQQNRGFIEVDSEVGVGAAFKVYLPAVIGKAESVVKTKKDVLPTGTETILLVEDEDMVRNLARKVLQRQGYQVLAVERGGKAHELAKDRAVNIDLLLTDVIMPDMNGKQLYETMRALRPDLRVLYMSGYTEDTIAHHGVLEKGINFIQKPFSNESLTRTVREVLDGK